MDRYISFLPSSASGMEYVCVSLLILIALIVSALRLNQQRSAVSKGVSTPQPQEATVYEKLEDHVKDLSESLARDKIIYYQLQNQDHSLAVIQSARERLTELLDEAVWNALQDSASTIISLTEFEEQELRQFIDHQESETVSAYSAYLSRRRRGAPRELLLTRSFAEHWLKISAPVRFVDGGWLGGIHHVSTLPRLRRYTRIAWQMLSEELGDGDLAKNHVHLFAQLLKSFGCDISAGDSIDFIRSQTNPNDDARVWKAAIAQLAIAANTAEFIPEILGFTLAYEMITFQTLVAAYELKELGLDPTYFNVHITVDNSHSGHTAMAAEAVTGYLNSAQTVGERDYAWRRVQAGFLLCSNLPATPTPRKATEERLLTIFVSKLTAARSMHENCRARFGSGSGRKLGEWIRSENWEAKKEAFLGALAASPWVKRGDPARSRLVKEFAWGGKMFGAFTNKEVITIMDWIREMSPPAAGQKQSQKSSYLEFTGHDALCSALQVQPHYNPPILGFSDTNRVGHLVETPLWEFLMASAIPFQYFVLCPAKSATPRGMVALNILRALHGFEDPITSVSGMDEVVHPFHKGIVEMAHLIRADANDGALRSADPERILSTAMSRWAWLDSLAKVPEQNFGFLLGAQLAFTRCVLQNQAFLQRHKVAKELEKELNAMGERLQSIIIEEDQGNDETRAGFDGVARVIEGCPD